jgi:hypothetical protein
MSAAQRLSDLGLTLPPVRVTAAVPIDFIATVI